MLRRTSKKVTRPFLFIVGDDADDQAAEIEKALLSDECPHLGLCFSHGVEVATAIIKQIGGGKNLSGAAPPSVSISCLETAMPAQL